MLVPMLGNYKPQILIHVDTSLCFSYSRELEESRWRALFNLLNIAVMSIMDHKIGETLRKLVTRNLLNLGQEENEQSVLWSVKKHASLLDI